MTVPATIGRYRVLQPLGSGAMGVVYRAHDPQLDREVALKVISTSLAAGHGDRAETVSRFSREARVAARLHHPNVVSVYDAGEVDGQLYLVMELVEGDTLASRLARGQFPGTAEALEVVAQAADALAAAHVAGVIHRDMKPGNLLLTARGQVKVADFGIARAMGESTELTRTGMMVGSPAYMAPEQVQGRTLDGRADLFSLGVVLYEMLLHRKPFPADTLTTLVYQILHEDPVDTETVTRLLRPELADFLKWALAKDPAHRVPDAATFAARARAIAAALPNTATAPTALLPVAAAPSTSNSGAPIPGPSYATSAPTSLVERPASSRLPWIVAGVAIVALVGVLLAGMFRRPAPPPAGIGAEPTPMRESAAQPLAVQPVAAPAPVVETAKPEEAPAAETVAAQPETKPPAPKPAPKPQAAEPSPEPVQAPAERVAAVTPPPEPAPPISSTWECRTGAKFNVDPEEAMVTIDGKDIGISDDWDDAGGGKAWIFGGPGEHVVKLSLRGYHPEWVRVRVTPSAKREIVEVEVDLREID